MIMTLRMKSRTTPLRSYSQRQSLMSRLLDNAMMISSGVKSQSIITLASNVKRQNVKSQEQDDVANKQVEETGRFHRPASIIDSSRNDHKIHNRKDHGLHSGTPLTVTFDSHQNQENYVVVPHRGRLIRVVRPYLYEFDFRFKQRDENNRKTANAEKLEGVNTTLKDLLEFQSGGSLDDFQLESLRKAISLSNADNPFVLLSINGLPVLSEDQVLKTGDRLHRVWHRHERSVMEIPFENGIHLYESSDWIALNKPGTVPVHPGGAYRLNSLKYIVQHHRPDLVGKLYAVHRLDRLTSGLIIFAKSAEVATRLSRYIQNQQGMSMRKTYLARVRGRFEAVESEDDTVLKRPSKANPGKEWVYVQSAVSGVFPRRSVSEQQQPDDDDDSLFLKESASRFMFLAFDPKSNTSLIKCEPITGRTHQLRIHLRSLGFPIANDIMYGGDDAEERLWSRDDDHDFHRRSVEALRQSTASSQKIDQRLRLVEELCSDCRRIKFEPPLHRGIFLHSLRIRLLSTPFDEASRTVLRHQRQLDTEFRAPLPEWIDCFKGGFAASDLWDDAEDDVDDV